MLFQQLNANSQDAGYDDQFLEILEQQMAENPRQTWCLCCCNSGTPGAEAYVVSRYPYYLSEAEVRQLFAEGGYNTSYWVQKLPTNVEYKYESSGEWGA